MPLLLLSLAFTSFHTHILQPSRNIRRWLVPAASVTCPIPKLKRRKLMTSTPHSRRRSPRLACRKRPSSHSHSTHPPSSNIVPLHAPRESSATLWARRSSHGRLSRKGASFAPYVIAEAQLKAASRCANEKNKVSVIPLYVIAIVLTFAICIYFIPPLIHSNVGRI